jgi:hypothetical protein
MTNTTSITLENYRRACDANILDNQQNGLIPTMQIGVGTGHFDGSTNQQRKGGEHPEGICAGACMIKFQGGKVCEDESDDQNEPGPCAGALMRKAHRDRAGANITWAWTHKGVTIMLNENILIVHGDCTGTAGPMMALVKPVEIMVEYGVIVEVRDGRGQVAGSPAGLGGWLKQRLIEATTQLDQAVLVAAGKRGSKTCRHDPEKMRELVDSVIDSGRTRVISHWEEYAAMGKVLLEPVAPTWLADLGDETVPADIRDTISRLRSQGAESQLQVRRATKFVGRIDAFSRSNYEAMPQPTSSPRRLIRTSNGEVVEHPPAGKYGCLSYVWRQWEIDNVLPSILQLSRNAGIEWLWVDQLCIDQENETEKSIEVGRMGDYYSGAAITLALVPELEEASGLDELKRGDRMTIQDAIKLPNVAGTIARAAWSTRVWTFQEAVLSRNLCIVGTMQTVNAQVAAWRGSLGDHQHGFKWAELSGEITTNDFYTGNGFLKEVYVQWDGYGRGLSCQGGWRLFDIGDAWRLTSKRKCLDERDRVYGLLGCIKEGTSVRIDYTQGVKTLLQALIDANMGEVEILATNSICPYKGSCWAPKALADLSSHCFKIRLEEPSMWMKGENVGVMAHVVDRKVLQEILGNQMMDWATERMLIVEAKTQCGVVILSGQVTGEYLWHRERGLEMEIPRQQKQGLQWHEWSIGCGRKNGCGLRQSEDDKKDGEGGRKPCT